MLYFTNLWTNLHPANFADSKLVLVAVIVIACCSIVAVVLAAVALTKSNDTPNINVSLTSFLAHLIHHQMCLCYRKLEICWFSGADRERIPSQSHVISLSQSQAQNREGFGSRLGADREWNRSGTGVDPLSKSCDLSEPIRDSESQKGSAPDLFPICSLEDPLPKVMWSL